MYQIDKEKFGEFLAGLRKEKGYTQKELAELLFVTDKAVSKWERGLSLPDIALLSPLAEILGVTVTELLRGQRSQADEVLNLREVEELVTGSIELSEKEQYSRFRLHRRWAGAYLFCVVFAALATGAVCLITAQAPGHLPKGYWMVIFLGALFGGWLCLGAREVLPSYYDENKISFYSDGIFRMNIVGLHFNNKNWPHILRTARVAMLSMLSLTPVLVFAMYALFPQIKPEKLDGLCTAVMLCCLLPMAVIMVIQGKRYE